MRLYLARSVMLVCGGIAVAGLAPIPEVTQPISFRVVDTDWATLIVHPGDQAVVRAVHDM